MSKNNMSRVLAVLKDYGEPITAKEVHELLPDINIGTIGSSLSNLTEMGQVICIYGRRPYSWMYNADYDPHDMPTGRLGIRFDEYEQERGPIVKPAAPAPAAEVAVVDPWERVRMQWRVVFGVQVTAEDARLMVELAAREARK